MAQKLRVKEVLYLFDPEYTRLVKKDIYGDQVFNVSIQTLIDQKKLLTYLDYSIVNLTQSKHEAETPSKVPATIWLTIEKDGDL